MAFPLLRAYLVANALLVLALLIFAGIRRTRLGGLVSYRHQLQLGYVLLGVILVAPVLSLPADESTFLPATTQVWSATSMEALNGPRAEQGKASVPGFAAASVPVDVLSNAALLLCIAGVALSLLRIAAGMGSAWRVVRSAHVIRRAGALRVLATDTPCVPFSFWLPGAAFIVVPSELVTRPGELAISLRHEGQHHRQGDTRTVYALELVRGLFLLNPAMHMLLRHIRALQELACDEQVVANHRVPVKAYCDCLVDMAQGSMHFVRSPACLHMAGVADASQLARRIRALLERRDRHLRARSVFALGTALALAVLGAGTAMSATIQDKRVSLEQAQEMASNARAGSTFPIVVNAQVLAELNRLIGTPDGRAFTRSTLQRMAAHQTLITDQLETHGLPMELLAVPFVESGYRNLAPNANPRRGAGIWMFIAPTARRYGLQVGNSSDQRLDVPAETTAAMKMLSDLHSEFDEWTLALLAYNAGTERVRAAIRDGKVADAFQAASLGFENDEGYVARVMAAAIVLKNVQLFGLDLGLSEE